MSSTLPSDTNGVSSANVENEAAASADATTSKRSNALSNKLTSVLSSSYANNETRDALRLLDARGARNVEDFRLSLKSDAQKEVVDANARIVDDFGKVASQLKRVGALITILNQTCDDMRAHIQLAKQETAPMLEEASTLLARKQETESKQLLLTAFNQHFLVSDEDLTTLTSSAEPVNDRFFDVLARVKQIHKDCEILLGYENQRLGLELMEQTTRNLDAGYKKLYNWIQREFKGLDLEDPHISGSIRRSLRALSERPTLFQNCLDLFGEARQATLSEAFQRALTDSTLGASKAIEFSTHDPLRYIGDMLAWVHSTTVSEKEALEGLFISDADEISRGLKAGKSSEPWARVRRKSSGANGAVTSDTDDDENDNENSPDQADFDGHAALNSLISRNMAAVSQILNQRISLTIRNLAEPITIYKAYNLLLFYQDIFIKMLGVTNMNAQHPTTASQPRTHQAQNSILTALSTLESQTLTQFKATVSEDIETQAQTTSQEPTLSMLQPPSILSAHLTLFSSILRLRAPNLAGPEFTTLYSTILGPVLELCANTASSLSSPDGDMSDAVLAHSPDPDLSFSSTIFKLNYLHQIHSTLTTLSKDELLTTFVTPPMKGAASEIEKLVDELAESVAERFLTDSGVRGVLNLIDTSHDKKDERDTVKVRNGLLDQLEEASAMLDSFLASALMDAQDDLSRLGDKTIAKKIVADAVEEFCEGFEKLSKLLDELDDDFEDRNGADGAKEQGSDGNEDTDKVLLTELYPRTVAEVRALLS